MKRIYYVLTLAAALFIFATTSFATNGYQLMGIGSTQKGMGGAVTAAPEDAMTAITNPAGMAVIGQRADFNGEAFIPQRNMDFTGLAPTLGGPGGETSGGSELFGIPALGWTAPAFGRDDLFFGGGMYATAGLGVDYDTISAGSAFGDANVFTSIQFWKMSPTLAWNVNEQLSVGVGLNVDYQQVEIRELFTAPGFKQFTNFGMPSTVANGGIKLDLGRAVGVYGGGITIGAIYKVNDMVTVGASYASEQWFADMKYRVQAGGINNLPFNGSLAQNTSAGTYKLDMTFPQQAALGIAVTPLEALTVEFDVKWINWDQTHDKVKLSGDFTLWSLGASGFTSTSANSIELPFGWDNQWVIALGARYAVNKDLTLRIGWNYADAPIDEGDVFNNIAFPAVVEQHLGLGATYNLGPHWAVSVSYMRAFRTDLTGVNDVPKAYTNLGFSPDDTGINIELQEDSAGVQISYRF